MKGKIFCHPERSEGPRKQHHVPLGGLYVSSARFFVALRMTILMLVLFNISSASLVASTNQTTEKTFSATRKLKRGVVNMLISPGEVGKHMMREVEFAKPDYAKPFYGTFYGFFKGMGYGVARFGSGFIDFLTFPVPYIHGKESLFPLDPFTYEMTQKEVVGI